MTEVFFPDHVNDFISQTEKFLKFFDMRFEFSDEDFESQSKTYFVVDQADPIEIIIHQTAASKGSGNKIFRWRVHAHLNPDIGAFIRGKEGAFNRYATLGALITEADKVYIAFQCIIPTDNIGPVAGILAAAIAHAKNSLVHSIKKELSPDIENKVEIMSVWGDIDFEKIQYNHAHLGLSSCERRYWELELYPVGIISLNAVHDNPYWGGGLLCLSRLKLKNNNDEGKKIDVNLLNSVSDLFSEVPTFGAWCGDGDDVVFVQFIPNFLKDFPNLTDLVVLWARKRLRSVHVLLEVYDSLTIKNLDATQKAVSVLADPKKHTQQEESVPLVSNSVQDRSNFKQGLINKFKNFLRNPIKNIDDAYSSGNFVKAFRMARPLAEQGEPAAQLLLGMMYYFAQGVDRNPTESAKWMELSAEKLKIPLIQQIVGTNYLLGDGVKKDVNKGLSWLRLSADQGFAPAQFDLGKVLQDGICGTKNSAEAAQLYELADQQPMKNWNGLSAIDAMKNTNFDVPVSTIIDLKTRLGLMYYEGNGVAEDPYKAAIYFQEAAQLGGGFSSIMLAAMYEDGLGVERNYFKAFELYKIAIDREMPFAMSRLATLFEKGLGVEKDLREALNLYKLSADQDDPDGIAGVERVRLLLEAASDEDL